MTQIIKPEENRLEVAHILRKHIDDYQDQYPLWPEHRKIVFDLLNCRTADLGGHIDRCDHCGMMRIVYHSCRNRHCLRLRRTSICRVNAGLRKEETRFFLPATSTSSLPCRMNSTSSS